MPTEKTEDTQVTFDDKQQELVNKRIGEARVKARELAKTEFEAAATAAQEKAATDKLAAEKEWEKLAAQHQARVAELEPLAAQVKMYEELIEGMLKTRLKALNEAAKKAVKALPETMTAVEKLAWLDASGLSDNDDQKGRALGSPPSKLKKQGSKGGRPDGHQRLKM